MNNLIRKTGSEHAKHVAVLHGGFSGERAISLSSGEACAQGLEEQGFRVTKIDVSHDIAEVLKSVNADVVFNALHGPFGEDGRIQGILEYLSLPYTHSGVLASALAMDKERAKIIARSSGVPVAPSKLVDRFSLLKEHPMPFPYVIKPVYEGSSLGVILVENEHSSIESLLSPQWLYGDIVMVERYIPGIDLTCAVMGDIALEVCEILPVGCSFYNYDSKYSTGKSEHRLPANLSLSVYKKIQEISLCAHRSLGCRGVTRSDFRYDHSSRSDGDIVWLEINTQPGMTKTSLLPEIACFSGYSFSDLLGWIVEDASCLR